MSLCSLPWMMSQYGSNNEGTQVVSFHKGDRSCNECRWSSWQKQLNIHFSPNRVSFVCWKGVCKRWFHSMFIFTSCVIPCSENLGLCSNPRVCRVRIEVYAFVSLHFQQFWVCYTAWRLYSSIIFLVQDIHFEGLLTDRVSLVKSNILWIFRKSGLLCKTLERVILGL